MSIIRNPFAKLFLYYGMLGLTLGLLMWLVPAAADYLPVGKAQTLIAQADGIPGSRHAAIRLAHPQSFGASMVWLVSAVVGALLTVLPVSWVYMDVRADKHYDQSVIDTIVVLPLIVTGIVVVIQDSLALSFSLAGIAGIARYRNNLKTSGDLLFILLAISIGLASGIGAVELALVMSAAFNFCFLVLWATNYGGRPDMERFLNEAGYGHSPKHGEMTSATVTTAVVTQVAETFAPDDGD